MADKGSVGSTNGEPRPPAAAICRPILPRIIRASDQPLYIGARNDTDGSAAPPCLQWTIPGEYFFRWAVEPGSRQLSIMVRSLDGVAPFPSVTILSNPAVGLAADIVNSAAAGSAWQQIVGSVWTASAIGTVWVRLACDISRSAYRTIRWGDIEVA